MSERLKRRSDIRKKRKKKSSFIRFFILLFKLSGILVLIGISASVFLYFYIIKDLPKISSLANYKPRIITTVYSDDSRKIAEFYNERRIVIPLSDMPRQLKDAFIAAEDSRFYKHKGIDFLSLIRAFLKNIEAGTIVQGGSTITQQVAKSFFLTPARNYVRKMKDIMLAYLIDKRFTKEQILYLYLNQIYLGHGAYGVEAAANNYFGKTVSDLDLAESSMLAGLPQAPSKYSPFRNLEKAKERQIYVLNRMIDEGYITNEEATEAINKKFDIKPRRNLYIEEIPYYTEHIRRYIVDKYGEDMLYNEGLKVYTSVNIELQKAGQKAVETGLFDLDKRQGYRKPLRNIPLEKIESYSKEYEEKLIKKPLQAEGIYEGVVIDIDKTDKYAVIRIGNILGRLDMEDMKWARTSNTGKAVDNISDVLKLGDIILVRVKSIAENQGDPDSVKLALEQKPAVQAALLCIEAETGHVKSMIGGFDFKDSQFNRAIQAKRQPGSAFKPIIYSAALDKGYTPATILIDSPVVFWNTEDNSVWKPKNYKKEFYGPTLFRDALALSKNIVTVKLLKDIGIDYTIDYAKKMRIKSELTNDLSLALGSSILTPFELVTAYSIFANKGYYVEPVFITEIVDRDGNVLEKYSEMKEKVLDENTAYIMTSMLESVVQHGTGRRAKALKRPVAAKTGTTNNFYDAWFIGYSPEYVTGVWVGYDDKDSLGEKETGARAASPIWIDFMKKALENKPVKAFQSPEGVIFTKIDANTGLLAGPDSEKTIIECFKEGTEPTEYTPQKSDVTEVDLFKYEN